MPDRLFRMKATHYYFFTVRAGGEADAQLKANECEYENDQAYSGCDIEIDREVTNGEPWEKEPLLEPPRIGEKDGSERGPE